MYICIKLSSDAFPLLLSSKFIPLMAEVHKALLHKDNEAWHFLQIPTNGSSLIFHQTSLHIQYNKHSEKMFVYINPKFLRIRARKLTSKKILMSHGTPFLWKECCPPLPRNLSEKTLEMGHVIFPETSQEAPAYWVSSYTFMLCFVCTPNDFKHHCSSVSTYFQYP